MGIKRMEIVNQLLSLISLLFVHTVDYPYSPRGDGNLLVFSTSISTFTEVDYPYSPRGDGNRFFIIVKS